MTFGQKLRYYRKKKDLTQRELASLAGLGFNTIGNYENGNTYPHNRKTYEVLAGILGCDVSELTGETDGDFVSDAGRYYGSSGRCQAQELVERIGGLFAGGELSEDDKDAVMRALQDYYWEAKDKNSRKG